MPTLKQPATKLGADSPASTGNPATPHRAAPTLSATSRPPLDPVHAAVVAERKAMVKRGRPPKKRPTRDAVVAMQYRKLAELQPHVLARVEKAIRDEKDPLHEMVMDRLMLRVLPMKFWEHLAQQEFAPETVEKRQPVVNIVIGQSAGVAADVVSEQ